MNLWSRLTRKECDFNSWFGFALYGPRLGERSVSEWVKATLVDSGGEVAGVQLHSLATCGTSENSSFGGDRNINEKTLQDVCVRSGQGKISLLSAYDRYIHPHASLRGLEYLTLDMRLHSSHPSGIRARLGAHRKYYNPGALTAYLRRVVCACGVDYGCIVAGLNYWHVDSTIDYTRTSFVEEYETLKAYGPDHPRNKFGKEISYYQSKTYMFGQHIPRASWGNILSPAHVDALGGETHIRKKSRAYLVERWGENLYLQLTKSLWDCTNDDLLRLNRFLEPARFPEAPEPVYLDPSSNPYPSL